MRLKPSFIEHKKRKNMPQWPWGKHKKKWWSNARLHKRIKRTFKPSLNKREGRPSKKRNNFS
jgi:hypothetical protein